MSQKIGGGRTKQYETNTRKEKKRKKEKDKKRKRKRKLRRDETIKGNKENGDPRKKKIKTKQNK